MRMKKIAIIGGGASGLACAAQLLRRTSGNNVSVTVFEQNERVGKKLLSTGNGRCNMTNLYADSNSYGESVKSFVEPTLSLFDPKSTIDFFAESGLFTRHDSEGRVYPLSNQASGVLDSLRLECEKLGVDFKCSTAVTSIKKQNGKFHINNSQNFDCVVLASGGKAAVKQYNAFELLASLGHSVTKTAPSLVKLVTTSPYAKQLRGIRANVELTLMIDGKKVTSEKGELLFGDGCLSGICAMQLSPFINRHFLKAKSFPVVSIDFVPEFDYPVFLSKLQQICRNNVRIKNENLLSGFLPKMIGVVILKHAAVSPDGFTEKLTEKQIKEIASLCKNFKFEISSTKGYSDAQVMLGGAANGEFDPSTLESLKCKNFYCCGEVLDVDGPCGGFNLQWAFSSGRMCAKSIADKFGER